MNRIGKLLILLLCFTGFASSAAHLVGGEMTYECQGGGDYLIRIRVYRDCAGGGAAFDPSIDIRAFDGVSGALAFTSFNVPRGTIQTVPLNTGDPCLTIPPGLCTEYADYETIINLPMSPNGYDVTWQRCCRNSSISNIPNPGSWGNTYTIKIPANDSCGSSPAFNNTPPIVLCINEPLSIDASATDADGDSLYYEFCPILTGGMSGNPTPIASPPPYTTIPFIAPQTFDNPIPSSPQIRIDSLTGRIYGEASLTGQFVVGICVSSYKNGVLETMVRRDFQFNVSNCVRNVVSDMVTQQEDSSLYCAGTTLTFTNQASNALAYHWDFGDTTTLSDTSNQANPTFTFPRRGRYNVTLIINPGTSCADTAIEEFQILPEPQLEWGILSGSVCWNVQDIFFGPIGTDLPNNPSFTWYFGGSPAPNITQFQGTYPPGITWPLPGRYPVTLVMNSNTCTDSIIDTIEIVQFNQIVDAGPDQIVYYDEDVFMAATGGVQYYWYADFPFYSSDIRDPNMIARPENDTTVFYVEVTTADGCQGIDSMTVIMVPRSFPDPDYSQLPNVITPNGDGANDFFDLSLITRGRTIRFVLHNRWGAVVYDENEYDGQWRGQDNGGNPLPDGTYYYVLQEGFDVIFRAPVTLIRGEQ
ncbi:MAG: gliding motility-associated C-terminal domain-containing protein [Flavobacteriia bacterium]|nr:gliding motility-associated C-terminal domain-containing protein [Flavobacteriia bacterium]